MTKSSSHRHVVLSLLLIACGCSSKTRDGGTPDLASSDLASRDQSSSNAPDLANADGGSDDVDGGALTNAARAAAVTATANTNAACTILTPFYWEIGDANAKLAEGSYGTDTTTNAPVQETTLFSIASASKWIYGMYVAQKRGAATNLTATDANFLHFTSGYTCMGSSTTSATCSKPTDNSVDSIDYCLTLPSPVTKIAACTVMTSQDPAAEGVFYYDSGHEENHAGQLQPELNALGTAALGEAVLKELGLDSAIDASRFVYSQPLLAGGIITDAASYATILRAVLSNQLVMHDVLGTNTVCAWKGTGCNASYTPLVTEKWHYSISHWVEDDATQSDGSFSSPGAFGFYPWIDSTKTHYGIISRQQASSGGTNDTPIQEGVASAQCGYQLRRAWETGVAQ